MIGFPLLLIPFAIYNIFVFLFGVPKETFAAPIVDVPLMSGATWAPTFGDALLTLGALLLLIEAIKASRPGARYLTDHLLSLILLGAAIAEFTLLAPFATSTFFLLTVLAAVEFLAGASMSIRNRKLRASAMAPAVAAPAVPHEIEPTPAPAGRGPSEPSFDPPPHASRTVEPALAPVVHTPEPRFDPPPAAEPLPDPVPRPAPAAEILPPENLDPVSAPAPVSTSPVPERSVAQWSVADLVADHDPEPAPPSRLKP